MRIAMFAVGGLNVAFFALNASTDSLYLAALSAFAAGWVLSYAILGWRA